MPEMASDFSYAVVAIMVLCLGRTIEGMQLMRDRNPISKYVVFFPTPKSGNSYPMRGATRVTSS